ATDTSKVYGAPLPAFKITAAGFVNGDAMSSLGGALAFSTSATASSPVGLYAVTPNGLSSSDYAIAYGAGTLTIQRASTTTSVTASATTSSVGQPVTYTATVAAVAPGAGVPTGSVQFFDGTTLLGTVALTR